MRIDAELLDLLDGRRIVIVEGEPTDTSLELDGII